MKPSRSPHSQHFCLLCWLWVFAAGPRSLIAQPQPAAIAGFDRYVASVEARLARQHAEPDSYLILQHDSGVPHGGFVVEQLTPTKGALPGTLLHHWRATAFAPGASAEDFEHLLRDFNGYPRYFAPEVVQARILTQQDDRMQAWMRVRQHHILTVVMDTTYDVLFSRLDAQHGASISRSTRISEIASAGTAAERTMNSTEEHGFLWRINTYWSYEERDGGLYLQVESVSLSRSIPRGLGWAVEPFIQSIPRESLEFTLLSTCNALRR